MPVFQCATEVRKDLPGDIQVNLASQIIITQAAVRIRNPTLLFVLVVSVLVHSKSEIPERLIFLQRLE